MLRKKQWPLGQGTELRTGRLLMGIIDEQFSFTMLDAKLGLPLPASRSLSKKIFNVAGDNYKPRDSCFGHLIRWICLIAVPPTRLLTEHEVSRPLALPELSLR